MEKITIKQISTDYVYDSFEDMLASERYIGFIPKAVSTRYMLITGGSDEVKGCAVRPGGVWSSTVNQPNESGTYYHFESEAELLNWLGYNN
jgi:hypothetical protein